MADKQGELFPEDKKPKSTKKKRRKSLNLPLEERVKIKNQRKQQAESNTKLDEFNESEREYWKKKNQQDSSNLKIQSGPDYAGEKAKVGNFDRDMDAYRKAKNKGNLTNEDRIRILGDNAKNYGRLAIKANPTGMVLPIVTGAASLMIKSLQGQILGGI